MQYRPLGQSGIQASAVGFGAWPIGGWVWGGTNRADAVRAIQKAIDLGINLIDTAPIYGFGVSEEIVGEAIKARRDRVVLATKCGVVWHAKKGEHVFNADDAGIDPNATKYSVYHYIGPESIRYEVEQSLRRLKTDVIDLYQTHWQSATTPISETMGELMKLKKEGKIRAIGVSNATTEQMDEYRESGQVDSDQEQYSMLHRDCEKTQLPYCAENGLAFLAYSPLAGGLLTGKVGPDRQFGPGDRRNKLPSYSVQNRKRVATLLAKMQPIADSYGLTIGQLVVAWTIAQPGCSHALVGARTPAQAAENAKGGETVLAPADVTAVTAILDAEPAPANQ